MLVAAQAHGQFRGENGGLGPLEVRGIFPPTLPYLDFSPEQALTLPDGSFQFTYQYLVSNTFINTEDPGRVDPDNPITPAVVDAGLTPANFSSPGYGLYLDAELEKHQIRFDYGLTDSLEFGLDLAWISLGGGNLDQIILDVENVFNALNLDRVGIPPGRMDYYLVYNGRFIHATSTPFSMEPQDPVLSLKWNVSRGGAFAPAFSIKLSYKYALESDPQAPRDVISSGYSDYGYSFLFGKRVGNIVAHFQQAITKLNVPGEEFQSSRKYRFFALEYQIDDDNAFVLQVVSQTGLFKPPTDLSVTSRELVFSKQTELSSAGFKHGGKGFQFTVGFTEDLNSTQNESDISLYTELGWQF